MIEEAVIVTDVQGGKVWIKSAPKSSCGGCEQQASCGSPLFEKLLNRNNVAIEAICSIVVRSGDQVIIGVDENVMLNNAFKLYIMPLVALFLCGLMGKSLSGYLSIGAPELMSIGFALVGFFLSIIYLKNRSNKGINGQTIKPEILRKC